MKVKSYKQDDIIQVDDVIEVLQSSAFELDEILQQEVKGWKEAAQNQCLDIFSILHEVLPQEWNCPEG